MKHIYKELRLSIIENHSTGYKYFITGYAGNSIYAFRTRKGMKSFLSNYNLKIGNRTWLGSWNLIGEIGRVVVWNFADFQELKKQKPKYICATENGHKTIGLILDNTLYVMNSNTDPFYKNSLLESYTHKANPERKKRYYRLFHN